MANSTKHEYTVRGKFSFPFDMLRYDHAWPRYEREIWALESTPETREIQLISLNMPNVDRWRSFGWTVVSQGVVR